MVSSVFSLVAIITAASATSMQINYYTDGGCSNFNTNVFPFTNGYVTVQPSWT
jgi:hypothetical protein